MCAFDTNVRGMGTDAFRTLQLTAPETRGGSRGGGFGGRSPLPVEMAPSGAKDLQAPFAPIHASDIPHT